MDNRARIEKEKLKLKNIKIRQKVAKQQLKSGKKQEKKAFKLRKKRQKKLNAKVDNLLTLLGILIFGTFAVIETLQNKQKEQANGLEENKQ